MRTGLLSAIELERLSRPRGTSVAACVEAIAERLVAELGIRSGPVDLDMVASYVDVAEVRAVPALPVAGCLITSPSGRTEIRLRAEDSVGRRRFSEGHEITHTFFPGFALQPQYRCAPAAGPRKVGDLEALCDVGAASLLLPSSLLRDRALRTDLSLDLVLEVADEFNASVIASAYRIARLSQRSVAVITLEMQRKPSEVGTRSEAKLRVQTASSDAGWPYIRRHKSASEGDVFHRALLGEIVSEKAIDVKGLTAMPINCDVHARLLPYSKNGVLQQRVIALLARA